VSLTQSRVVFEDAIKDGGNVFRLHAPIPADISMEDGVWACESKPMGILAFGASEGGMLCSFAEDLAALWGLIAQARDEGLTSNAIRLKRTLHAAVKSRKYRV
jgi:hypothetical protein